MKRKILIALMTITAAVCTALGLAACGDKSSSSDKWDNVYTVEDAYSIARNLGYDGTFEQFIESIKGKRRQGRKRRCRHYRSFDKQRRRACHNF